MNSGSNIGVFLERVLIMDANVYIALSFSLQQSRFLLAKAKCNTSIKVRSNQVGQFEKCRIFLVEDRRIRGIQAINTRRNSGCMTKELHRPAS